MRLLVLILVLVLTLVIMRGIIFAGILMLLICHHYGRDSRTVKENSFFKLIHLHTSMLYLRICYFYFAYK